MENDSPTIEPSTETIWHVVVIGKSGTGKSATCNTLLGGNAFESKFSTAPTTKSCKSAKSFIEDIKGNIMIIDTPGIFDVEEDTDAINAEMKRCIELSRPGFNAILMVISLSERFTSEDQEIFKQYKHHFGGGIMSYVIVVFTNADRLEGSIEAYVENAPSALKRFLKSCGDRYFAIENKKSDNESKEKQRKGLLNTIMEMVHQNKGCMYTDYNVGVSRENTEDIIRDKIRKEMQPEFERQETMVKKKIENNEGEIQSQSSSMNVTFIDKFIGIFPKFPSLSRLSSPRNSSRKTINNEKEQISTEAKITQSQETTTMKINQMDVDVKQVLSTEEEGKKDLDGQEIPDVTSNEMVIDSTQGTTHEEKYNTEIAESETEGMTQEKMDKEEKIQKEDEHSKSVDEKMDNEENNTQDDTGERNKQEIAEPETEDMTKEKMNIDLKQTSSNGEEEIQKDDGHVVSVDGKIDEKGKNTQDDTGERNKQDNPETATLKQKSCDPCSSNNDPKKGLFWCEVCEECYCAGCYQTHKHSKLTKNHKLIELKENK